MPLHVSLITSEEFDHLQAEWNDLLDRSASDSVFLRWEWIHTWWSIFHKSRTLFILTAHRENRLVGIAPVFIEPAVFPTPRRLRFCSDELSPDYMDLIIEKGHEIPVTQALVQYLLNHVAAWDMIYLDQLRAGSSLLTEGLFDGLAHDSRVSFKCPYIQIQGPLDDYLKTRPRSTTDGLAKQHQRFFQRSEVTHTLVKDPATLSRHMDDLFALRKKRSASKGLRTTFTDENVKRFHKEISRLYLMDGRLNLQFIYDNQTPVSTGYSFSYKKKLYLFQTAFDPAYKKWSPGGLILRLIVQHAFSEGFVEFDMLKGDDAYKNNWCNAVRDEMCFTAFSRNLRGRLGFFTSRVIAVLRRIKNRLTGRGFNQSKIEPGRAQDVLGKQFDALVLNAPLRQSLVTVRSLGRRGLGVAVAGALFLTPASASRWCQQSYAFPVEEDSDTYINFLDQWLERTGARVLIPLHDGTIGLLRQHRARVEKRVRLALADEPALAIAVNKERTFTAAARLGLNLPREVVVREVSDLPRALRDIGLPAVVKPCESWLRRGHEAIRLASQLVITAEEARRAVEAVTRFGEAVQFQQLLSGRREAVSFIYANGKVHARFAQWAARTQPPLGGQSTVRQSIEVPRDIGTQAEALIRDINLEGYSEVEFRRDAAGVPYLMEINPRLSASVEVAVRAGVDFPYLLYQWAIGDPIDTITGYRIGGWMRHLGEILNRRLLQSISAADRESHPRRGSSGISLCPSAGR